MAVVAAIVRRREDVLVVRNVGAEGAGDRWSLPGGSVHAGELLTDAVAREAQEETGLVVNELGPLAVYSEHYIPAFAEPMVMVAFEVLSWSGDVRFVDDPDGEVCECSFVPALEAARLIEQSTSFLPVSAPVVAHLRGGRRVEPVTFVAYARRNGDLLGLAHSGDVAFERRHLGASSLSKNFAHPSGVALNPGSATVRSAPAWRDGPDPHKFGCDAEPRQGLPSPT